MNLIELVVVKTVWRHQRGN